VIARIRDLLDLARSLHAVPHLIEQQTALELRVDELEQRHEHLAQRHEHLAQRHENLASITEELYLGPRHVRTATSDRSGASARRPTEGDR
jgi:uncharacterized protein (DUF3084 family)